MIKKINEIRNIELVNRIFEFLKTTPILKSLFKEIEYDNYILKDGIHILITFLKVIIKLLIKYLLYVITIRFIFNPFEETGRITFNQNTIIIFFSVITIIFSMSNHIMNFEKKDYLAIKLLRIDRKKYVKSNVLFYIFSEFIYMFIILLIMRFGLLTSTFMAILNVSIKILMERIHLHILTKSRFQLLKNFLFKYVYSIIFYMGFNIFYLVLISFYEDISLPNIVVYIPATIVILLAIYMVYYLIKKYNYNYLCNKYLTIEMYELSRAKLFAKSIDTEYTPRKSKVETEKKGFEYLYYLFNKRYAKSLVVKALFFGGMCALLFFIVYWVSKDDYEEMVILNSNIYSFIPFFGLFITLSPDYLKLCYTQLDSKLLSYNFYKNNTLVHMKYRFLGFIKYELLFYFIIYFQFLLMDFRIQQLINIIIYILVGIIFNTSLNFYFYFFVEKKEINKLKLLNYGGYVRYLLFLLLSTVGIETMPLFCVLTLISFVLIYLCYKNVKGELKK